MQAREDMGGIQERFQALSRSMTLSIATGAGIFISPFSSLDSHLACTACVKMLLKVDTSEPMKATSGTLGGMMLR